MKRDMDFVRDLLFQIEDGQKLFNTLPKSQAAALGLSADEAIDDELAAKLEQHLELLESAGFAEFHRSGGGAWFNPKLTWTGHEFLDNVRDKDIWEQAKTGVENVGGAGLDLLSQLAKGLIKTQLEKHTGVKID